MFALLLFLMMVTGSIAVVSFVLYVNARAREEAKREQFYKTVHYVSLGVFTILGVLELIVVSQTDNFG
jgi:hypothetical protein